MKCAQGSPQWKANSWF